MKFQGYIKYISVFLVLMLVTGVMIAQPGGGAPFGGGGGPGCWPPPCIPIDGGIAFLAAAGIALGGKKLLDLKAH